PILEALPNVGVLFVLVVGTVRVTDGSLAAGALVQVAYLLTTAAFPVRAIGWVLGELPAAVVGWRRVWAVLDATGGLPYGEERLTGDAPAAVNLNRVGFSYQHDGQFDGQFDGTAPGTDAGSSDILHDL